MLASIVLPEHRSFPPSPALLVLDCQIVRVSSCPLFSATDLLPNRRPSTVLPIFCSLVAYGLCVSPAMTLCACFVRRPNVLFCRPVLTPQVDVHLVRRVLFFPALLVWELGAWDLIGNWRFQVTLFSGPSILQAPGERFLLGGSRFQGCHGYLPFGLWLLLPANLLGTSSRAHLFVMSLNVAKYNLG